MGGTVTLKSRLTATPAGTGFLPSSMTQPCGYGSRYLFAEDSWCTSDLKPALFTQSFLLC